MRKMPKRGLVAIAVAAISAAAVTVAARNDQADAAWLLDVLELRPGSVVADIGAGAGELTVAIARHVTDTGRVYASELGDERLDELRNAVRSSNAANVIVVDGDPEQTNLPDRCCDAVFMRAVYHHFANPRTMNASLWRSLKPGGRIAVIDFAPRGRESREPTGRAEGDRHGVTAETVAGELRLAGFTVISSEQRAGGGTYVVAVKPAVP